jgi:hypothetical protein
MKKVMYKVYIIENGTKSELNIKNEEELNNVNMVAKNVFIENTIDGLKRHREIFQNALLKAKKAFR